MPTIIGFIFSFVIFVALSLAAAPPGRLASLTVYVARRLRSLRDGARRLIDGCADDIDWLASLVAPKTRRPYARRFS